MAAFSPLAALALLAFAAWAGLMFFHGRFWRADQRLGRPAEPKSWPAVVAVLPARNEAKHVGAAVASLQAQDYPGTFRIVVVDDGSDDGTAEAARLGAADPDRLIVVAGRELEPGWTGKMWAVHQGLSEATAVAPDATYLLLTDADIAHDPRNLRRLVAKAETDRLDLVSLMVRLRCDTLWERLLIPAFVFFFQKLYPFPRVNEPRSRVAAAAGGCMLVRAAALERIGGVRAIRDRVIDDCALAAAIKPGGPIWLGLADPDGPRSLRGYDGLGGLWRMVARSAYVQLDYALWRVAGTVIGMMLLYLVPPAAALGGALVGDAMAAVLGSGGWAAMLACYRPTLDDYRQPMLAGLLLPLAALLYVMMTVDSARLGRAGRGSAWKGRTYPATGEGPPSDSAKAA